MKLYEDLGHGVYHLDTHYIRPGVASLYCVVEQGEVAIIETGTAHSLVHVQQFLEDLSLTANDVKYVVPTHVHLDHAGGAGVMMRAFPQAQLVIHPRGARHMIDPTKLVNATKAVYGEDVFNQLYGEIPPINKSRVITAAHESSFNLKGRELLIIDTPGHAYHHFCVVDPKSKGVFTGDTFGLSYPNLLHQGKRFIIPTTTPTHFNPVALHQSVDLIMSHQPQRVYLTHFNMLTDPAPLVSQYHNLIDDFAELTEAVETESIDYFKSHPEADRYRSLVDEFVELNQEIKPQQDNRLDQLITAMGNLLAHRFDLTSDVIEGQLAMDIKLNSQGLAYWYQHREQ